MNGRTLPESLEAALGLCDEARGHLGAALMQTIPSDDRIVVDHMRVALEHLDTQRDRLSEALVQAKAGAQ